MSTEQDAETRLRFAAIELLRYAERQECHHAETHRAGVIWTICDGCGASWADDMGGPSKYVEPRAITEMREALAAGREPVNPAPEIAYVRDNGESRYFSVRGGKLGSRDGNTTWTPCGEFPADLWAQMVTATYPARTGRARIEDLLDEIVAIRRPA